MVYQFRVFSADWESTIESTSYEEAAIKATLDKMKELGERFMIAPIVVTVNKKSGRVEFVESAGIFEDLQMYSTSKILRNYIKKHKYENFS